MVIKYINACSEICIIYHNKTHEHWQETYVGFKLTCLPKDALKFVISVCFSGSTEQLHKQGIIKGTSSEHTARQRTISS